MNWQRRVAAFARSHGLLHDPATHALDLASEVGEVAKGVLEATDYGRRPFRPEPGLAAEMGDALYSLLTLAEACGVDADQALEAALAKYEHRLAQRGDAGSGDVERRT
ncbi:MAG TPA: nucleotide pyrophosphohydrolase [Anaerolineales bacterium]|nr:nucleotide pyrophosphohydrolase [Anaerolineae bacterium]HIQ01081.1 nucleotide pyrophosphohydrolase [Anaerolineales bacterium]